MSNGPHEVHDGDGRNIDPGVGRLEGEASQQRVAADREDAKGAVAFDVFEDVPSRYGGARTERSYYDRPTIKEPVWIWAVPAYFYVGGAAGAAAVLGAVAQAVDRIALATLVKRCRWIAATGSAAGAGLLIHDLGRPERFLNMLRVFRPTSALNVGSWILAASVSVSVTSAVLSGPGALRALGDAAGYGAGLVGMPLSGYTAVLLSDTAVPLWQETRRTLPPLFVVSALSSAASLLQLGSLSEKEERIVERLGVAGKLCVLVAMLVLERDASRVETVAEPLHEGSGGSLWKSAKVLTAAGVAGSVFLRGGPVKRVAAATLATAGALALRFAVFHAGKASSRDPRATASQQRAGHGAKEVTRTSAVVGSGERRAVT
jgi:formate-dependent nitrite reductase membrane component NrfD